MEKSRNIINSNNNPYTNINVHVHTEEIENINIEIEEENINQLRYTAFRIIRRLFRNVKEEEFLDLNGSEL